MPVGAPLLVLHQGFYSLGVACSNGMIQSKESSSVLEPHSINVTLIATWSALGSGTLAIGVSENGSTLDNS